jgi:demethylmenaquinone methyltransferase/2-methoxy-6-polyprenyl-1,4-benzoquinol methylase
MATDFRAEKNRRFAPGKPRGEEVNQLFTAVAPRYDLINDLQSFGLHRLWKQRVIDLARPRPGEHALDICCGTGDLAVALARRGVETVGLDFNETMLRLAEMRKSKAEYRSLGRDSLSGHCETAISKLRFVRGDAQQLPFPQDSFDIVTVGYGLRNLASWETGLIEMHRVSRPGGRLLVLDFGKPDNRLWRVLFFGYLRLIVPLLGLLVSGQPGAYAYILESLQRYPAQRGVEQKMRELGLVNVRTINVLGGTMSINYGAKPVARG